MDHLKASKSVLVGLSVGGLIVQGVYHARPDLVQGLILCDTAAKIGNENMWNDRIAIARDGGLEALVEGNMQRWFSPNFHKNRQVDLRGYEAMFIRTPLEGYLGTAIAIRDADFTDKASSILVPTTCVVGEEDGATPPALVQGTAKMIPDAKFEAIKEKAVDFEKYRKVGDRVGVKFNVRGNEYNGQHYVNLQMWYVESLDIVEGNPNKEMPTQGAKLVEEGQDDLPF